MENCECKNNEAQPTVLTKLKKSCFSIVLLVIVCGVLYLIATRVAKKLYRIMPENGRAAAESLLGKEDSSRTGSYLQHPYMYYVYRPGYKNQFNALGHRSQEVPPVPAPGTLRILCIGGSTTISFPYTPDAADAWPVKLGGFIAEQNGIKVEEINAGLNGANSADLLAHYMFRNRHMKAHIVVIHVGGNDAWPLLFPNYNAEYTHFTTGWRNVALAPRPFERDLLRNHIIRCFYAWWLKDVTLDADLGRGNLPELPAADCMKNVQTNDPSGFRNNLDALVRNIIQDGAIPVIFPFVRAPDEIFQRQYKDYTDSILLAYQKNILVMNELSQKYNILLTSLPEGAIPKKLFKDWCHVNAAGDEIKALHLAQAINPIVRKMIEQGKLSSTNTTVAAQ